MALSCGHSSVNVGLSLTSSRVIPCILGCGGLDGGSARVHQCIEQDFSLFVYDGYFYNPRFVG